MIAVIIAFTLGVGYLTFSEPKQASKKDAPVTRADQVR